MISTASILKSMVPVSRFNRGEAGKIFDELSHVKTKIVIKNNVPIAVLLSPEEYTRLIDETEDSLLLAEAAMRLTNCDESNFISEADFIKSIGLTEADLNNCEEVEIE